MHLVTVLPAVWAFSVFQHLENEAGEAERRLGGALAGLAQVREELFRISDKR